MTTEIFKRSDGIRENLRKSISINAEYYTIIIFSSIMFGFLNGNMSRAIFTLCFMFFWAYLSHTLAHSTIPLKWFHAFHHHEPDDKKWYDDVIETFVNIFGSGGIIVLVANLIVERMFGVKILDNHIILYNALLYTSTHMFNYHYYDVQTHVSHHLDPTTNFGPDIMDIIFGSKQEGGEIENMDNSIINVIILAILVAGVKYTSNTI